MFRTDAEVIPGKRRIILTPGESAKTVDVEEKSPEEDSVSEDVMKGSKTGKYFFSFVNVVNIIFYF